MTKIRAELSKKNPLYIDKHAFLSAYHFALQYPDWKRQYTEVIGQAIKALSEPLQPWEVLAAQVVLPQPEIVRCEECLYRKICSWEKQGAKFCSFAEKREVTT